MNSSARNSERLTRKRLIDPKLKAAGWNIVPFLPSRPLANFHSCAIEEFETANGPADYALCAEGRIIGIVEAKKLTLGPQSVLTQAERYCKGIENSPFNYRGFRVPFLYSTNGEVIWHHDIRHELCRSHVITEFHTPEALIERLQKDSDTSHQTLLQTPNNHPRLRSYQIEANAAIEKAIADQKQQMLVAMATGTGKTFTMVNEVYRLMKSGVAKRILFLVDRRALAAQAVLAFASFEPEPGLKFDRIYEVYSQRFQTGDFDEAEKFDPKVLPSSYLTHPNASHAFVYVSTIQRMTINLFGRDAIFAAGDEELDEDATKLDIPIHAFDLVIADECHRGYTSAEASIWRKTLDHFDAIKIGLTATPAAHTTAYFKDIVYRYEYERAVREGHLVDYDVITVKSDVRVNGIFLKEGEQVDVVNPESGAKQLDLLEDERQFDSTKIEREITSPDSNKKILEEVKKWAEDHEKQYGRFPKTLIFAANDLPHTSHADQLVEIGRDVFGRGDSFVQKITGRVDRPLQWIRQFRRVANLGEFGTDAVKTGPFGAILKSKEFVSSGVPILAVGNVQSGQLDLEKAKVDHVTEEKATDLTDYRVRTGDVLFTRSGTIGRSAVVPPSAEGWLMSYHLLRVRPNHCLVDPQYLHLAFSGCEASLRYTNESVIGTTRPGINTQILEDLPIPLPPRAEQKRVVAKFEDLRCHIRAAQDSLSRVSVILKRFRQAVLAAACSGRLTEDWRTVHERDESVEELRDDVATKRRQAWDCTRKQKRKHYPEPTPFDDLDLPEIPQDWTWVSADEVCSQITDGEHIQPRYKRDGFPMITAKHVRDGFVEFKDVGLISKEDLQKCLLRCSPTKDDILIVSVGATTGRAAIVDECKPFAMVRSVLMLRPVIESTFLLRWIQSPWCQRWISQASGASAQPHFYIHDNRRMPVPLAPVSEQLEIARRVDALFALADEIERRISASTHLPQNLHVKLDPRNYYWITPALAAVVGFVLGVDYGIPSIVNLQVIYDGAIVVLPRDSNRRMILCHYDELVRGWKYLLSAGKLTKFERIAAEALFATKIGYCWFEKGN